MNILLRRVNIVSADPAARFLHKSSADVLRIDTNRKMVSNGTQPHANRAFRQRDISTLPFKSVTYDILDILDISFRQG